MDGENIDYDEMSRVTGGTLYRKANKIWVIWDAYGRETWTRESIEASKKGFADLRERWTEE